MNVILGKMFEKFMANLTYKMRFLQIISLMTLISMLTACGGESQELNDYINKVKSRPPQKLAPVPEFKVYQVASYTGKQLRDPFKKSVSREKSKLAPDVNRPKEPLEAFPLDSLHMVGTLSQGDKLWALIATQDGVIYRIAVGNYLGQNFGRVVNILLDKIEIIETVQDQDDWIERPASLVLNEAPQ